MVARARRHVCTRTCAIWSTSALGLGGCGCRRAKTLTTFAEYATFDAAACAAAGTAPHELFVWAPNAAEQRIVLDETSAGCNAATT
jgi:hypothetical protein